MYVVSFEPRLVSQSGPAELYDNTSFTDKKNKLREIKRLAQKHTVIAQSSRDGAGQGAVAPPFDAGVRPRV